MTILGNCLKRIFRKRTNIIFMIVVPILLNIFLISVSTREARYNVGILNKDSSVFTQDFISRLEKTCHVELLTGEDDIKSMILNKSVDCAFAFETGFTDGMIFGKDVSVKSYTLGETNIARPVQMFIASYISASKDIAKAAHGNADLFYKGMNEYHKNEYATEYKDFAAGSAKEVGKAVSSLGYIAFGMVFLLAFSTALILEDKLSGVYDRVAITPLKRSSYFIEHMLGSFIVAAIQIVILINNLPKIVNVSFGSDAQGEEVILICCVFAIVCISIGVLISRYSKNMLMAGALATLVNLPLLMLGGCLWPREIMPEYIRKIGDFMPTTWFLKAGEAVLYGKGIMAAMNEIVYMLLLAAFLLVLSFAVRPEKAR